MITRWSLKQHFSLRAGTMLLAFCCCLVGLAIADPLYDTLVNVFPPTADLFWRLGSNFERYLMISGGLSLFFLGRSLLNKEPQVQFVIELILAGLLYQFF
ncbi:MAG: hypothetical protein KJ950_08985 [Proteobacteria bacterium]|nr:hypothetical protein [Pseudomonadota bacterium]MBU1686628.1 hypothetical protein [Pseudomonadota bacterium]